MRNINLDITYNFKNYNRNAGPKARKDVSKTLNRLGYKKYQIFLPDGKKEIIAFNIKLLILFLAFLNSKKIVIQYPAYHLPRWFIKAMKLIKNKITFLIHDINFIPENETINEKEKGILSNAKTIIVHTPAMKEYIEKSGIKASFKILYLFDYYTDIPNNDTYAKTEEILFCGNLSKSKFIYDLKNIKGFPVTYIYGNGIQEKITSENIHYLGTFDGDRPEGLEGSWGLVWDGPSTKTCETSREGQYLTINTSHKISLYLILNKPLILWSKSSLADWALSKGIAITIDSLDELAEKLRAVSSEDYNRMIKNIRPISEKLRTGGFLENVINNIEK